MGRPPITLLGRGEVTGVEMHVGQRDEAVGALERVLVAGKVQRLTRLGLGLAGMTLVPVHADQTRARPGALQVAVRDLGRALERGFGASSSPRSCCRRPSSTSSS
jgi:hypothetical protein